MEAKVDESLQTSLTDWGRVLLEEILVQGAMGVPPAGVRAGRVEVTLSFELTPDRDNRCIEIRSERLGNRPVVAKVPL
jgi:hypothetical protein